VSSLRSGIRALGLAAIVLVSVQTSPTRAQIPAVQPAPKLPDITWRERYTYTLGVQAYVFGFPDDAVRSGELAVIIALPLLPLLLTMVSFGELVAPVGEACAMISHSRPEPAPAFPGRPPGPNRCFKVEKNES
jgi:hypothetical protein